MKRADLIMLCVEARDLLGISDFKAAGWAYWTPPPDALSVECWTPEEAEARYLDRYTELLLT